MCACVRTTAAILRASNENGSRLSVSSVRGPWNRPQSIRIARPSCSSSMHEPVTVPAAPWKVILGSLFVTAHARSEEHTSELQSLMRISYAVFCLNKKNTQEQKRLTKTELNKQQKRVNIQTKKESRAKK